MPKTATGPVPSWQFIPNTGAPLYAERIAHAVRVAKQFKTEPLPLNMGTFTSEFCTTVENDEGYSEYDAPRYKKPEDAINNPECGTTVCLAGRLGLDPYFRKQGFTTNRDGTVNIGKHASVNTATTNLHLFFGLSEDTIDEIFFGDNEYKKNSAGDTIDDGDGARQVDKRATLNALITLLKAAAREELGVKITA